MQKKLIIFFIVLLLISPVFGERILVTKFNNGAQYWTNAIGNHLTDFGYTVDTVNITSGGALSAALSSQSYDQIYLYDHVSTLYLNSADTTALANFYNNHSSLVIDTRSYCYYVNTTNATEKTLLNNIANAFSSRGGGVWVGTDHASNWLKNANSFLGAIGVNPVVGTYYDDVNDTDPDSILLDGVNIGSMWVGSIGKAPLGLQPSGIDLRYHFGHSSQSNVVPYITASFGDYITQHEDPTAHIPEIGTSTTLILSILSLMFLKIKTKIK